MEKLQHSEITFDEKIKRLYDLLDRAYKNNEKLKNKVDPKVYNQRAYYINIMNNSLNGDISSIERFFSETEQAYTDYKHSENHCNRLKYFHLGGIDVSFYKIFSEIGWLAEQ